MINPAHKLAAALLNRAADRFSNHCCNDFDLIEDGGLTKEEARQIQELVRSGTHPDEQEFVELDSTMGYDWQLMRIVADKLLED